MLIGWARPIRKLICKYFNSELPLILLADILPWNAKVETEWEVMIVGHRQWDFRIPPEYNHQL